MDELAIEGSPADSHPYMPTSPRLVRVWLDRLPIPLLEQSTFVDLGSGRGRVLLMASEKPFRSVVGVEHAAELHAAALDNIARFPASRVRCPDVRSLHGDAAAFTFPLDPLVMYFDNPFSEKVMAQVIQNLGRSYEERRRAIVLIYQQQVYEDALTLTGNLALLDQQGFLTGRTLRFPLRDRPMLSPFLVRIYCSTEGMGALWAGAGASHDKISLSPPRKP